jgi:hypothetical protein
MKKIWLWLVVVVLAGLFSDEKIWSQEFMSADGLASIPIAPQEKLAECDFNNPQTLSVGRAYLKTEEGGAITLSGRSYNGRSWTSTYSASPVAGCELWEANLDANTWALFLASYGTNSSGGWDTTLSVLYFDNDGNPFPWEAMGYVEATPHGIANVVRLKDTRAVGVIIATRESDSSQVVGHDMAHRDEFRLYKLSHKGVEEIKGVEQGVQWPFIYENAKANWGTRPSKYSLSVLHSAEDGVSPSGVEDRKVHKVEGIRDVKGSGPEIVMSDMNVPFPAILVVDSDNGRHIVSGPTLEDVSALKISKATAEIFGNNCSENDCYPVVVWIKK